MHQPHCTQVAIEQGFDQSSILWYQDDRQSGGKHTSMINANVKPNEITILNNHRTFSFLNAFGFQSNATFRVYPPQPGRPASPGGLGIIASSESVEESDFVNSESSDPDSE